MISSHPVDDAVQQDEQERTTEALQSIVEQRAPIEHAKGMLMFVYGVDADTAFAMLRDQSQKHNVKLRLVAEQVVKDMIELSRTNGLSHRSAVDGLMATANQRIANSAARQLDGESKTGVPVKDLGKFRC